MKKNKKILFICPYPIGVQAGQRFKYEQHFNYFIDKGYEINVQPFMDKSLWNILYKRGYTIKKIYGTIKGYLKRFLLISKIQNYDLIYIFLWVTPFLDLFFEKIIIKKAKKTIFDLEDNVLIKSRNIINPLTFYLKSVNKTKYLIKNSDIIISSSKELKLKCNQIAKKNKSFYISPGIDLKRFNRTINYNKSELINIGWTGTFSSVKYLKEIEPALEYLSKNNIIKFIVISNHKYINNNIDVVNITWNKVTEIEDLLRIDIGVYPLIDEEWVIGKSGLKALQYMALGIPTVASKYGNIIDIIDHMNDGILIENKRDWIKYLQKLIYDIKLRKKLGQNSRQKIIKNYTTEIIKDSYLKIFDF
jgi:glycosyltransferase involved in cell wall biosynthesis